MVQSTLSFARPAVVAMPAYKGGTSVAEANTHHGVAAYSKLASNECPYPPSLAVRSAIAAAALDINQYPDGNGLLLKQRLASKHGVGIENLILGSGSSEILGLLMLAFGDAKRGDCVLTHAHAFLLYRLLAMCHGLEVVEAPVTNWVADLEQMALRIDSNTRLIYLANPANPTGTVVDNQALESFIRSVPPTTLMVLDQAYADFYPQSDIPLQWLSDCPNLVIARTFSKASGLAGLRVGYALAEPGVVDILNKIRPPFNVNSLAQAAACAVLDDTQTLEQTVANNEHYRQRLVDYCKQAGIASIPSHGNFVSLDLGSLARAQALEAHLLQAGIIVRSLRNYAMEPMLRITIGTPEQMEQTFAALDTFL